PPATLSALSLTTLFRSQSAPEIREADLAPLALELALWGTAPEALSWLDPPPAAALAQARTLLQELGALDENFRITPHGREIAGLDRKSTRLNSSHVKIS